MSTYSHRFYLGPHSPLSVPLSKVIKRNAARLLETETECPPSEFHRATLSKLLKLPEIQLADDNTRELYFDTMLNEDNTRNLIYDYDAFLGSRKSALKSVPIYPSMEAKITPLRLFTKAQRTTVFMCLQSYTDLIKKELAGAPELQRTLAAVPENIKFSWISFVSRFQAVWPEAQVVIIDANKIAIHWAAIVALVTGHPETQLFRGINDFPLMNIEEFGQEPFKDALSQAPPKTVDDWIKLSSHFFSKYGYPDTEEDPDGKTIWTIEQTQYSMRRFTADIEALRKMKNVLIATDLIRDFK